MWVAIEATTLASAPHASTSTATRASLEATWKYLLIGSVGIALALLGSLFLAYSALARGLRAVARSSTISCATRRTCRGPWLRAAFVLLFVGYGTKMGLAPMHTWKPDAYGEAPGLVGALLAGGADELRVPRHPALLPRSSAPPATRAFVADSSCSSRGLFSMAVAGVFMARQKDFKRMLAYSSVEHMGILVVGIGIGGAAFFGSLLHMLNNGLTKGVLFLVAGNIQRAYGSKSSDEVRGALRRAAGLGRAVPRRVLRHHGLAPVRAVPQRVHDPQRRRDQRALRRGGGVPGRCSSSSSSGWARRWSTVVQGKPSERAGVEPPARDSLSSRRAERRAARRSCSCSGSTSRGPSTTLLRDAAASLEGGPMSAPRCSRTRNGRALDASRRAPLGVEELPHARSSRRPSQGLPRRARCSASPATGDARRARRRARRRHGGDAARRGTALVGRRVTPR